MEITVREYLTPFFYELNKEIDSCGKITRAKGNKVKAFLMLQHISALNEITYGTRQEYEAYLKTTDCKKVQEYVKTLDRLKLHAIQKNNEKNPGQVFQISYAQEGIYLGYHPDYQTAMNFYYVQDKSELVFDFSIEAPEKLKHQIFSMLVYSLERPGDRKNRRELYLVPLKRLYLYCVEHGVEDIEQMQEREIAGDRFVCCNSYGYRRLHAWIWACGEYERLWPRGVNPGIACEFYQEFPINFVIRNSTLSGNVEKKVFFPRFHQKIS